ncbi:hypothetical protein AM1_B0113 (plasmid) [Acaryochloris marina MBIC11017]|uniref:Uncharacterized protein n=1 Tax=Acaryochloris marina (strain MBIC 11017) TaxID=329726 RepID=A8ZM70_ACAM1|nr:hypothetical protein AM1_B0113 [Acaryochloris marina MBIC11017]
MSKTVANTQLLRLTVLFFLIKKPQLISINNVGRNRANFFT